MSRDPHAIQIAGVALRLAQQGDLGEAANYVKRLSGSTGIIDACLAWIDTYMGVIYPDHKPGQPIAMRWLWTPTDETQTADDVQPPMRWAGRLIALRAADDYEGFMTLLRSVPEGAALGDCIMALLHCVAESLNNVEHVRQRTAALSTREERR